MKRLLPLLALFPILIGASITVSPYYNGLVGYWPLTSGYTQSATVGSDRTPYANHCTSVNGATFGASGITLSSGSSQYLDCGDADEFSFTDGAGQDLPFSGVVWLVPSSMTNLILFAKQSAAGEEYAYQAGGVTAGKIGLYIYTDSTNYICKRPSTPYADVGVSTMYGFSYDGTEAASGIHIYRNGVETTAVEACDSGSHTGMSDTTQLLKFGYNGFSYSSYTIQRARLYNRALSADDFARAYAEGPDGADIQITSLVNQRVLALPLTSGWSDGTYPTDRSGSFDHMTATGGTPTVTATETTFNGSTDYYQRAEDDWRSGDSSGCVSLWFKTATVQNAEFFTVSNSTAADEVMRIKLHNTSNGVLQIDHNDGVVRDIARATTSTNLSDNEWHLAIYCSSGTGYSMYVDDVTQSFTLPVGSDTGDWFADVPNVDVITVAAMETSGAYSAHFDGALFDIQVWSRVLTADERNRIYVIGRQILAMKVTP